MYVKSMFDSHEFLELYVHKWQVKLMETNKFNFKFYLQ